MALDKASFETSIKVLLDNTFAGVGDSQIARDNFANNLSTLIDNYIKSATITVPIGAVVVVGSATTQNNPAPIVINNSIT